MARWPLALAAIMAAGVAHAQQQTCQYNPNTRMAVCSPVLAPAPIVQPPYQSSGPSALSIFFAARAGMKRQALERDVTEKMRLQDCKGAVGLAMAAGDMALAAQVKTLCVPYTPPPKYPDPADMAQ